MSASTDPPSLHRNDETRTCPMCNRQVRARILVCHFCGANMLLERREQPAVIAQRRRRQQRLRSRWTLLGAFVILMATVGGSWVVWNGTPTCGSRLAGVGIVSCSRVTTEDRMTLLATLNRYSDATRKVRERRAECASILAQALETGARLRTSSFSACMRARRADLLGAVRAQDSVFNTIATYASGTCRSALRRWHDASARHARLTQRAAAVNVEPSATTVNLHRISQAGTRAEAAEMTEQAARRRMLAAC